MMTLQEIYSKVRAHLLTQGQKSRVGGARGSCKYRTPGGLKCAIGCLIPDDCYSPQLEGQILIISDDITNLITELYGEQSLGLLYELQVLHDGTEADTWEEGLNELAAEYNLEPC